MGTGCAGCSELWYNWRHVMITEVSCTTTKLGALFARVFVFLWSAANLLWSRRVDLNWFNRMWAERRSRGWTFCGVRWLVVTKNDDLAPKQKKMLENEVVARNVPKLALDPSWITGRSICVGSGLSGGRLRLDEFLASYSLLGSNRNVNSLGQVDFLLQTTLNDDTTVIA